MRLRIRILAGTACLIAALLPFACSEKNERVSGSHSGSGTGTAAEIHLPGGDWGLPTPFTFYPRGPGYIHLSFVYDTLVWKDRQGFVPWLAESWETAPNGATWTFHLRRDVRWQDGKLLTAKDVVFTFDYLRRHPVEWFPLQKIRNVEAPDDFTVVFHMDGPYAPFLGHVAGSIPVIPMHIWRDVSDPRQTTVLDRVVGSGPYRLVLYDKSQGAYAYEANTDFFLGQPQVRKILFVPTGDPVAALDRGDVDEAPIPVSLLQRFRNDKKYSLMSGPGYSLLTLLFNTDRHPFSEAVARHAFAHAIDRTALIDHAVPGGLEGARPGSPGFLPPDSKWFDPECQDVYGFDPSGARDLLRSLGIEDRNGDGICEAEDGSPMRFTLITTSPYMREAESLKLMLKEIGFAIDLRALDVKTLDAMVREGRFDLALTAHGGLGGAPSVVGGFGVARDEPLSPGTPKDPKYLETARQLLVTTNPAESAELCKRMQRLYADELPTIPLYYPIGYIAYRSDVFNGWFYTAEGGIAIGVPSPFNKLAFIRGESHP
jgi:peptide/nickel transport system substrate-binding protein